MLLEIPYVITSSEFVTTILLIAIYCSFKCFIHSGDKIATGKNTMRLMTTMEKARNVKSLRFNQVGLTLCTFILILGVVLEHVFLK